MINISSAINTVIQRLKKTRSGSGVRMLTCKRDRSVTVTRTAEDKFKIVEQGFENREFDIAEKDLKKTLKALMKREFPRSRKVRISSVP